MGEILKYRSANEREEMKFYPHHSIECIIHINWELCNCGTEEVEEEQARDLADENAIPEENMPLDNESQEAYYAAMAKDN
jgi:hypothetical protein